MRHRGRVVQHVEHALARDVTFSVSEAIRQDVIRARQKAVHAFVVTSDIQEISAPHVDGLTPIRYNPYEAGYFSVDGHPISAAEEVVFTAGRCYLLK